jgi:hypothetical protein
VASGTHVSICRHDGRVGAALAEPLVGEPEAGTAVQPARRGAAEDVDAVGELGRLEPCSVVAIRPFGEEPQSGG